MIIIWPCADNKELHSGFPYSGASASAGISSSHGGSDSSDDISSNHIMRSATINRSEIPLADDFGPDVLASTSSFTERELAKSFSTVSTNSVTFVDSTSCASRSNKMKSGHIDEAVDFKAKISKTQPFIADDVKPKCMASSKPIRGSSSAGKLASDLSKFRRSPSWGCSVSDSGDDDGEDSSELLKCEEVRSWSLKPSSDHPSSASGGHAIYDSKSTKIDGCHAVPAKVGSVPGLPQDFRNGLKVSMRKVVQQFRASKESKHKLSGLGNDLTGKQNCKVIYK